ncbi:hypothetical protein JCM10021v2_007830 [Rhodotorula toruloides]|uniref:Uncharacterized protein n=1 Tax=Rhodotorula toruloides TaxID=5286 RepID=A0A2T0AC59_RHOTO|nr:hypothetical protein AAT19DRAFT_13632 [Rhodotorula toruloides]
MSLHGAGDLSGVSGGGHANLAFSLSKLLREKMANHGFVPGLKGGDGMSATGKGKGGRAGGDLSAASFLVKRCPPATLARLDEEGGCFCDQLRSEASPCHGYNENDRRAICIEDLRDDVEREEVIYQQLEDEGYFVKDELKALLGEGERERSKRRRGTCGLEFQAGLEPESGSCPAGYARVGSRREGAPFICQDIASPYSCGREQRDCYAQPGVLQAECTDGECEIMMCQEGWRFHIVDPDEEGYGGASCVPSKPLFFNPPP